MEEQDVMAMHAEGGEASQQSLHPMAELLEQGYGQVLPKRGDAVEGVIVEVTSSEVLIDIGSKCEGIVTSRDLDPSGFRKSRVATRCWPMRSDWRTPTVTSSYRYRAMLEGDWRDAAKVFEAEEVFEKPVAGYNKGGLIVNIGRVRGFVPASQVVSVRPAQGGTDEEKEAAFAELVGKTLRLKIIELDRRRNRLILSERAAVREWRQEQKDRSWTSWKKGTVRRGVVSSLCDFGAYRSRWRRWAGAPRSLVEARGAPEAGAERGAGGRGVCALRGSGAAPDRPQPQAVAEGALERRRGTLPDRAVGREYDYQTDGLWGICASG